jgi:hypothetical protein
MVNTRKSQLLKNFVTLLSFFLSFILSFQFALTGYWLLKIIILFAQIYYVPFRAVSGFKLVENRSRHSLQIHSTANP